MPWAVIATPTARLQAVSKSQVPTFGLLAYVMDFGAVPVGQAWSISAINAGMTIANAAPTGYFFDRPLAGSPQALLSAAMPGGASGPFLGTFAIPQPIIVQGGDNPVVVVVSPNVILPGEATSARIQYELLQGRASVAAQILEVAAPAIPTNI